MFLSPFISPRSHSSLNWPKIRNNSPASASPGLALLASSTISFLFQFKKEPSLATNNCPRTEHAAWWSEHIFPGIGHGDLGGLSLVSSFISFILFLSSQFWLGTVQIITTSHMWQWLWHVTNLNWNVMCEIHEVLLFKRTSVIAQLLHWLPVEIVSFGMLTKNISLFYL